MHISEIQPELRLLVALLQRAVLDACSPVVRKRDKKEAKNWIFSDSASRDKLKPYSFLWCCDVLELDPVLFRKRIYKLGASDSIRNWRNAVATANFIKLISTGNNINDYAALGAVGKKRQNAN